MGKSKPSKLGKAFSELGASKGGKARASVLTPEERKEIAKRAAEARWAKTGKRKGKSVVTENPESTATVAPPQQSPSEPVGPSEPADATGMPYSMFPGKLKIGDVEMECHVLSNGARVLT